MLPSANSPSKQRAGSGRQQKPSPKTPAISAGFASQARRFNARVTRQHPSGTSSPLDAASH